MFAEAFAEPPYGEGLADVERAFRRFRSQVRRRGFRAAIAFDGDVVVGMAYGYPLSATTRWWDTLTDPVSSELRHEDGKRTFGLFELAVRPGWRRRGVATRMHHALVAGLDNARVMLNSRPEAAAAQAAYLSVRVRGYAVTMPLGGVPDWDAALAVLRADARRVKQEQLRCDAGKSARAESVRSARAAAATALRREEVRTCGFGQVRT
nr:GNAT family N-acetyltransferase [Streptomyces sp. XY431]